MITPQLTGQAACADGLRRKLCSGRVQVGPGWGGSRLTRELSTWSAGELFAGFTASAYCAELDDHLARAEQDALPVGAQLDVSGGADEQPGLPRVWLTPDL